jgi:hypothetical protein
MSIGLCVKYRDPAREEMYWPYLTQRHLTNFLWPLAASFGSWRVELLEVLGYGRDSAEEPGELREQFEAVCRFLAEPATAKEHYPHWEHVRDRTVALLQYLQQIQAEWDAVREVAFF